MFKQAGFIPGLLGGVALVVASLLLALQAQFSFSTLVVACTGMLVIVVIAATIAGWQARRFGNSPALAGAIVGGFITIGSFAGNMIIAASPAYVQALEALENLSQSEGGLQLTGSTSTVGSFVSLLLINVLAGTFVASLAARFVNRRAAPRPEK